ncbi:HD-GYP domain-containing protein [Nitrosomonas sp. wSCUT-2]
MISSSSIEIPILDLKVGMYVSKLDRPWLDTPFPLQGVLMRTEKDIQALKNICQFVFVDVELSEPFVVQKHLPFAVSNIAASAANRVPSHPNNSQKQLQLDPLLQRVKTYEDFRTAEQEIPAATKAYNFTLSLLDDITNNIERDIKFDIHAAHEVVDTLCESVIRNPDAALLLAQLKSTGKELYDSAVKTSVHMLAFGRHLGLPRRELSVLGLGGLLMDIGKQRLPKEIQVKRSMYLKPEERKLMKQHIAYSQEIVTRLCNVTDDVIKIVTQHHERENGNGYPLSLYANQIHPYGRMAAVVDSYEELIWGQPGMPGLRPFEAIKELKGNAQNGLNFALVEQFAHCISIFPVGCLVELNTGEVAIVLSQNRTQRFLPRIMIICDAKKKPYDNPATIDLKKFDLSPAGVPYKIINDLPQGAYGIDPKRFYL